MVKDFETDDIEAHISMNWFLDAMSLKLFRVKYPTFCAIDLASLMSGGDYLSCGYKGNDKRIAPLHAQDPNIYYSMVRYEFPNLFGKHHILSLDYQDIRSFFDGGIEYHKN